MPSSDPVEIYPDRRALARMALVGTLLVVGGAWMIWHGTRHGSSRLVVATVGAAGFLFFGWCLAAYIRALVRNRPILTLTDDGLIHRPIAYAAVFVPWDEIGTVFLTGAVNQAFVGIKLVHPEVVLGRLGIVHAAMLRWNGLLTGWEIGISLTTLAVQPEALFELLDEHLAARTPVAPTPPAQPDTAEREKFRRVRRRVQIGITLSGIAAACAFVTAAREPAWSFLTPLAVGGWIAAVASVFAAIIVFGGEERRILLARRMFWAPTLPSYLASVCTFAMVTVVVLPKRHHHSANPSGDAWAELVLLAFAYLGLAPSLGIFRRQRKPGPGE